jgi:hypothetical protein
MGCEHCCPADARTQGGVRRIRHETLSECLKELGFHAHHLRASIQMPRIGSGLAGGKWEKVQPLICDTIPGTEIFVYDLPRWTIPRSLIPLKGLSVLGTPLPRVLRQASVVEYHSCDEPRNLVELSRTPIIPNRASLKASCTHPLHNDARLTI